MDLDSNEFNQFEYYNIDYIIDYACGIRAPTRENGATTSLTVKKKRSKNI